MENQESHESIRRKAYLMGLELKNSGLEQEVIYARLEKSGIPEDIAEEVARNIQIERRKSFNKEKKELESSAWIKILIGVIIILGTALWLPGYVVIPTGFIVTGVLYLLLKDKKDYPANL